ncbi:MAG: hypothetical protein Q4D87_04750, partial [Actinomycetaceae bacterium]|nr:hypothetical protein [Actinomycetaceae bacterium]
SQQRQWENKPQQSQASQQQRQRESKPQQESAWNRNLRPETESGSNANQRTQWESGPDRQARQYSATPSNTTEVAKTPEADRYAPQGNTPQAATTQHDRETREELAQNITEETHESPRGGVKLQTFEGGARRNQSEAGTFESGAQRSQPEMGTSEGDAQTNQPQAETFDDSAQAFEGGARLDDQDAENMNLVGLPLVEKMFGARIIEETNEGNN